DAAENETKSAPVTVTVDNHAPGAPSDLAVDGGDGWRSANGFDVRWVNPDGQTSPIARAHFQMCAPDGSCLPQPTATGDGISELKGRGVPGPGEGALRVWLEDAAGTASEANAAGPVFLRYAAPPTNDGQPAGATTPGLPLLPTPRLAALKVRVHNGRRAIR